MQCQIVAINNIPQYLLLLLILLFLKSIMLIAYRAFAHKNPVNPIILLHLKRDFYDYTPSKKTTNLVYNQLSNSFQAKWTQSAHFNLGNIGHISSTATELEAAVQVQTIKISKFF